VEDLWGVAGPKWLDEIGPTLADAYLVRLESLRDLVELFDREVAMIEDHIARTLKSDKGYKAIQVIPGVGPILGAVFVAEIGDVSRFSHPKQLCSWAGLTPLHHESDIKVRRGKMTKQGSVLVRWAAIEAVSKMRGGPKLQRDFHRIADRRGKNIGRVAVARKLLTLVYYGLRDGQLRCFAQPKAAG
jgi:transposase